MIKKLVPASTYSAFTRSLPLPVLTILTLIVVLLSAGNRVELLVKAGNPGTYELVLTPGSSQKPNIPGMPESVAEAQSELFCRLDGAMSTVPAVVDCNSDERRLKA